MCLVITVVAFHMYEELTSSGKIEIKYPSYEINAIYES
jgi:hypothetical protein